MRPPHTRAAAVLSPRLETITKLRRHCRRWAHREKTLFRPGSPFLRRHNYPNGWFGRIGRAGGPVASHLLECGDRAARNSADRTRAVNRRLTGPTVSVRPP